MIFASVPIVVSHSRPAKKLSKPSKWIRSHQWRCTLKKSRSSALRAKGPILHFSIRSRQPSRLAPPTDLIGPIQKSRTASGVFGRIVVIMVSLLATADKARGAGMRACGSAAPFPIEVAGRLPETVPARRSASSRLRFPG